MNKDSLAHFVLRVGVAFAFLYPPLSAIGDPSDWIGYFPAFVRAAAATARVPDLLLLHGFGLLEVAIALWILSGRRIFLPSLAAAALLVGIVIFNSDNFIVVFRDLSIAAAALALAISNAPESTSKIFGIR